MRHQKLYACTYEECPTSKRFGSKNDWKRHEDTQHPLGIKMQWRCSSCKDMFDSERVFMSHCHERHNDGKISDSDNHRIHIKPDGGFWCGFCCEVIRIDSETLDAEDNRYAKDERYNHIAKHFHPDEQDIEVWTLMKGDRMKGRTQKNSSVITITHAASKPKVLPARSLAPSPPADDDDEDEGHSDAKSDASLPEMTMIEDADGDEEDDLEVTATRSPTSYDVNSSAVSRQHGSASSSHGSYPSSRVGLHQTLHASSSPPPMAITSRAHEASVPRQTWLICCQCSASLVDNAFNDTCMGLDYDGSSMCGHRYCDNCCSEC